MFQGGVKNHFVLRIVLILDSYNCTETLRTSRHNVTMCVLTMCLINFDKFLIIVSAERPFLTYHHRFHLILYLETAASVDVFNQGKALQLEIKIDQQLFVCLLIYS